MILSDITIKRYIIDGKIKIKSKKKMEDILTDIKGIGLPLTISNIFNNGNDFIANEYYLGEDEHVFLYAEENIFLSDDIVGFFIPSEEFTMNGILVNLVNGIISPGFDYNRTALKFIIKNVTKNGYYLKSGQILGYVYFSLLNSPIWRD